MADPPAAALPTGARVLITGGSGFIGTNLVEYYASRGYAVRSLDLAQPRNADHRQFWQRVDLTDSSGMLAAVDEFAPTHVFHFGARTDLAGQLAADYAANTSGVSNLLSAVNASETVERVLLASSMLVCRFGYQPTDEFDVCPATVYGESKVLGEQLVRENPPSVPWTIVRPTSIWGPWFGTPYRDFFTAVASGRYMHPGRRGALQTYGFVGNAVFAVDRLAASASADGLTLYLGDWPALDLRHWADAIATTSGRRRPRTAPLAALRAAAFVGDAIEKLRPGAAPLTSFRLANMTSDNLLDLSDLRAQIGDRLPWSLEDGVRETSDWLAAQTA